MNFAQRYVDSIHQHFTQLISYFYGPNLDLFQIWMRVSGAKTLMDKNRHLYPELKLKSPPQDVVDSIDIGNSIHSEKPLQVHFSRH